MSRLGQGLLAGSENGGLRYAARAARMLVAVLNGTPPAAIPREADDTPRFVIDYAQAVRWDIPESTLPPTAIFVNRPASFYQTNRTAIWGAAFFMLLQAAVIGALVVNIGRRRRAEQALAAQAEHLAASNADLERLNLSLRSEMNERRHAEEQLRQAQKIDAIGRLAGGVAHDFNNLLTVIGSYADILLETLSPLDPARPHAEHIRQATERAAGLTHQLLAFSRKQVMQPRVVDLNVVVRELESMLGRLIGEDIELTVRLSEQPATVVVDAGQIEQVIVNLAANGRDAMPGGGQLVIETRHLSLTADEIEDRPGMTPGAYVQLAVTDSGKGMDAETQARIFEPFFTTKAPGEGTGLGLSMAYGIVKQSGGWIWVYSEVGQGTTFKIYLPATDAPAAVRPAVSPEVHPRVLWRDRAAGRGPGRRADADAAGPGARGLRRVAGGLGAGRAGAGGLARRSHPPVADRRRDAGPVGPRGRRAVDGHAPGHPRAVHVGLHRQRDRAARRAGSRHRVSVQALHTGDPGRQSA